MAAGPGRLKGLWKNPDFLKFWTGQTISEIGSHITRDGLPLVAVITLSATPFQMGLLTIAGSVPVLIFSLVAGVIVDRLRRRAILITTDLIRSIILLAIPAAYLLGILRIEMLYVVAGLAGVFSLLFDIAYHAYLPFLVERPFIIEGNSKMAFSSALAELGGSSLAGVLIQILTAPIAILIDSVSFLASVIAFALIQKPEPEPVPSSETLPVLSELQDGIRFVFSNPMLRALAFADGTRHFFGSFYAALYSLYLFRDLNLGPAAIGLTIAMGGVGDLLGSILAEPFVHRFGLGRTLIMGLLLGAVVSLLIPLAAGPVVVVMTMIMISQAVGDGLSSIYTINSVSLRQLITPDRMLGRAESSVRLLVAGIAPFGALVGGALGSALGARVTLLIATVGFFLATLWLFFSPVRRLRLHSDQEITS